jgi:hypothetical protein
MISNMGGTNKYQEYLTLEFQSLVKLRDALQAPTLEMNLRRYIYQLLGIRQSSVVPAVCYTVCSM